MNDSVVVNSTPACILYQIGYTCTYLMDLNGHGHCDHETIACMGVMSRMMSKWLNDC